MNIFAVLICGAALTLSVSPLSSAASSALEGTLHSEAGFYEIEPISFDLRHPGGVLDFISSRIRLSYSFHPAVRAPTTKPLFVFFNGGPGCSTCEGLLSLNTAPMTLDQERTGSRFIKKNPFSWNELGNLLYVDAPNTGFSYNLMRNVSSPKRRAAEFDAQNFNPFIDAAQFARFLLRFLTAHPDLAANPVILVGESYGGVRSAVLLNLLLFYGSYRDGRKTYHDPTLADEIELYLAHVFPEESQRPIPPATIVRQFGRQILIQPLLAGGYQTSIAGELYERPGSPIDRIAAETGREYIRCAQTFTTNQNDACEPYENALRFVRKTGRDVYHYAKPSRWLDSLETFAAQGLQRIGILSRAFGWSALAMPDLRPDARHQAYRYIKAPLDDLDSLYASATFQRLPIDQQLRVEDAVDRLHAPDVAGQPESSFLNTPLSGLLGPLSDALGALKPWDDYLIGCNDAVTKAYYENRAVTAGLDITPTSRLYGELFLQDLAFVETFITQAAMDLVVYAPALPLSLNKYSDIVDDVRVQDNQVIVTYKKGVVPEISTVRQRTIHFPPYWQAGHAVPASQPRKMREDVRDWLLSRPN